MCLLVVVREFVCVCVRIFVRACMRESISV